MVNVQNQNVKDQAIVVSRIIKMYREMVTKLDMTKDTWYEVSFMLNPFLLDHFYKYMSIFLIV